MIEKNFGIGAQAIAILAFLENRDGLECSWNGERYCAMVRSAPWYNCRERGIVVYLQHRDRQINIAFFEHRVADRIYAALWESDSTINPPSLNDLPGETYNEGNWTENWSHGEVSQAADWVYARLEEFWEDCEENAPLWNKKVRRK
jgi:hypothetical protein